VYKNVLDLIEDDCYRKNLEKQFLIPHPHPPERCVELPRGMKVPAKQADIMPSVFDRIFACAG
jgi:hypothetical protein